MGFGISHGKIAYVYNKRLNLLIKTTVDSLLHILICKIGSFNPTFEETH